MAKPGTTRRALELTRVARRTHLRQVLREVGTDSSHSATRAGAVAFVKALEELGPTYIKLGQVLSSRPDLLPDVYVEELTKLVDDVDPLPFEPLRQVIAAEIGLEHFATIDPEPLATASIAQIHPAVLVDGRRVVVKVRRPGIVEQIEVDLDLLRSTAAVAEQHSQTARLLQLNALTDELERHLRSELDFREEAHNAEVIAAILEPYADDIVVPEVIRPLVAEQVLVLERIDGEKVAVGHALDPDRAAVLARSFFRAYIDQVTAKGIYHADPHGGNVLLTPDCKLALLDYGLMGRLDDDTRASLALLLLAIAQNRADDLADIIISLSLTTAASDQAGFVHELRRTLPRYHWRSLDGIRTGEGLADIQRLCLRHGIALPTAFALVAKTLSQAESIARALDPQLDPVEILRGEGTTVMAQEVARWLEPNQALALLFTQLQPLVKLPRRVSQVVQRLETGSLKVAVAPTDLESFERITRSMANRLGVALIIAALLVASALMARVDHTLAVVGFSVAAALGLYMIWRVLRTPGGV